MLADIILRELHKHILSLRLHLSLILIIVLFGVGATAFIKSHAADLQSYEKANSVIQEREKKQVERSIGGFMIESRSVLLKPRSDAFITDAKEKKMPYRFWYTGFNVSGFEVPSWARNDMMESLAELSWEYIVSIIVGFTVLLFCYDLVSGDKENGTLALVASNPVSRGTLLLGKYLSVIIMAMLVLLPGIVLSLIILLLSETVVMDGMLLAEIAAYMGCAALFVACMAAFGLLASSISTRSNVSLLICLCIWLGSVVVIPNYAVFFTDRLFPIESSQTVNDRMNQAKKEIDDKYSAFWKDEIQGKGLSQEEITQKRTVLDREWIQSEKSIKDAWNNSLINQFNGSRKLTSISPVSLFEQLNEAVIGGGLVRMNCVWSDLIIYQSQLLEWFKELDAHDPESMHIINPRTSSGTTQKGADFKTIPQFHEQRATFSERLSSARLSLTLLTIYTIATFALSFVLFLRYDVR